MRSACLLLAALPALVWSPGLEAEGSTPEGPSPATLLVGAFPVASGNSIDWSQAPGASLGLIGTLDELAPSSVVLLALPHTAMTIDDWALIGVSPAQAAQLLATLQSDESLSAVLDFEGNVLSIGVTTVAVANSSACVFVVSSSPEHPPQTIEELLEQLRRLLEELRNRLNPLPPPPPPGEDDPTGDW